MLAHPFFEHLAIIGITAGILATTVLLSPVALISGAIAIAVSVLVLIRHYHQADASTDIFA